MSRRTEARRAPPGALGDAEHDPKARAVELVAQVAEAARQNQGTGQSVELDRELIDLEALMVEERRT
jgi:hypothetical protein